VLRDATTRFPNLRLVDWNGAAAGAPGLTAGDGLHLTPAGANAMAGLVTTSVQAGAQPQPPPGPPSTATPDPAVPATPPTAAVPTTATPVPSTAVPATVASTVPTTVAPTTAAPATTVPEPRTGARAAADAADGSALGALGWTLGLGLVAVVVLLGVSGAWIALWSLWRTRGRAAAPTGSAGAPGAGAATAGVTASGSVPPNDAGRSARSNLRAERIAAARSHHPTAVPVPPEWAAGRPTASSGSAPQS